MTDDTPATDDSPATPGTAPATNERCSRSAEAQQLAFDVPSDRSTADCEYCERPFENDGLLALHRGLAHAAAITDEEGSEFEAAHEAETAQLRRFRLKALGVLILLYFGLLMVYAVV